MGTTLPEVFYAQIAITSLHCCAISLLLWRRRHYFPLTGREISLQIAFVITMVLSWLGEVLQALFAGRIHCGVQLILRELITFVGLNIFAARMWRLWFLYFASREKLLAEQTKEEERQERMRLATAETRANALGNPPTIGNRTANLHHSPSTVARIHADGKNRFWFTDRRHFVRAGFLWKIILGVSFVESLAALIPFIVEATGDDYDPFDPNCASLRNVIIASGLALLGGLVVALATAWRIRKIEDGYLLKRELKYIAYNGVFLVVMAVVMPEIPGALEPFHWHSFLNGFFVNGILVASGGYLLFQSFYADRDHKRRLQKHNQQRRTSQKTGLINIIMNEGASHADALKDFTNHLMKEFSVENLLFFKETLVFTQEAQRDDLSDTEVGILGASLFADYIAEGAPFQININYPIRRKIEATIRSCVQNFDCEEYGRRGTIKRSHGPPKVVDRVPSDVFQEAANYVFRLMERDPFLRWRGKYFPETSESRTSTATESTSVVPRSNSSPSPRNRSITREHTFTKGSTYASASSRRLMQLDSSSNTTAHARQASLMQLDSSSNATAHSRHASTSSPPTSPRYGRSDIHEI